MEGKRLKYGFLANHGILVGRVEPMGLLPFLVAEGVVTFEDSERIKHEVTSADKVDKLLTIVHRKGMTNEEVYEQLMKVLKEAGDSGGQYLSDVIQKIDEESYQEGIVKRFDYAVGILEERHNAVLKAYKHVIIHTLNVDDVLPQLISSGVVTLEENVAIRSEVTQNMRASKLVEFIRHRGSAAFDVFVEKLLESEGYRGLGNQLSGGSVEDEQQRVDEVLKQGHVPPRYAIYVERKEMTEKIRSELYKLRDTDGWVVVHGMAGFGKTVLAAEAVRDAQLLHEVFPGGINWLTVGQMLDRQGEVDTAKLLTKIQNLIVRLDERRYRPPNLEAATDYLQKVISEQYPRSLLILDDVWSPEVAQAFAVRCRTMVTSRNSAVASSVQAPHIYSVSVSEGFSEDEGRDLLGQWLRTKAENLPSLADVILKYCRGSPMSIALIGAILRRNNREAKWKAIVDKLEKNHLSSIHLHAAVNDWNYQHQTLKSSIELSVESLPDHLKNHFEMFVVFDYDTLIPVDALETIWDADALDTEEYMMELVGYSLAQQANPGTGSPDFLLFYVHDIVLDYLRDTVPIKRQVELHNLVVQRYSNRCNAAFAQLPDDGYVYQKLLGHVAASGNWELLGDLLSHLPWLISSVQHGDANIALANYREFKRKVPSQFTSAVQQFELFVSGHMYVLADQPKREDVLQLALLLPDSSEVFQQATSMVRGDRKKSWFKWSNKESDPEKYVLKLKLHRGGVRHCQYSVDGSKVVSCSSEGEVKLWDSSTGMVLADFRGHKDMVTWCALSTSGKMIVSCSEDLTVKVWDVHKRKLLREFSHHMYGVQCCAISPNEKLVLSADIDSCINVWEAQTGKVYSRWRLSAVSPLISPAVQPEYCLASIPSRTSSQESQGGGEGVLCCAFSVGGTSVVTASQNGAVRLWDLSGHLLSSFHGHTGQVRCCVFSSDDRLLATASLDSTVKLWNVDSSTCHSTLTHSCAVLSCDFSTDATKVITGDTEGSVKVWSAQQGFLLEDLPLHWDFVNCVLFSPSSPYILSAADNGLIKILWREQEAAEEHVAPVQYHRRFSAHFTSKGSDYDPMILCYNIKEKKLEIVKGSNATPVLQQLPTLDGYTPRCWVISNTGSMVTVGYLEGMLQLLQLHKPDEEEPTGEAPWSATEMWKRECAHDEEVLKCYFAPDDTKIATCTASQHKMWTVKDGKELAVINGRGIGVRVCVFFKDNVRVASAQEKAVLIWDSNTGVPQLQCVGFAQSEANSILCINISEDNSRLVASATSGLVMVWNTSNGEPVLKSLVPPLFPCARSCALSPDGTLAAAGFDDGSLKILNVGRGSEVAYCPTGSDYWMIDVAFSPDGQKVVTLCDSIEWWKTDGTHVKTVLLKGTFGKYIRFSPDFCTFVTIDNAGLLYILTTLQV